MALVGNAGLTIAGLLSVGAVCLGVALLAGTLIKEAVSAFLKGRRRRPADGTRR